MESFPQKQKEAAPDALQKFRSFLADASRNKYIPEKDVVLIFELLDQKVIQKLVLLYAQLSTSARVVDVLQSPISLGVSYFKNIPAGIFTWLGIETLNALAKYVYVKHYMEDSLPKKESQSLAGWTTLPYIGSASVLAQLFKKSPKLAKHYFAYRALVRFLKFNSKASLEKQKKVYLSALKLSVPYFKKIAQSQKIRSNIKNTILEPMQQFRNKILSVLSLSKDRFLSVVHFIEESVRHVRYTFSPDLSLYPVPLQ